MSFKKSIYIAAFGTMVLFPLACSKGFLDQNDTSNISETALFKKPQDGIALVNAIYDTYHNVDFMKKSLWYGANFLSQDFNNWGADAFFTTYEVPAGFGALKTFWERAYAGIARANSAIPIVAKMRAENIIDQTLADRLTGESYFLRGAFYYYLASNFGGVPLELQTVADDGLHPRNTQDEVFASIAADMTTAAGLLPWKEDLSSSEVGRATKGAALGYLGSAQMWLKKYTEAVATFNQLAGKYALVESFIDIHEYDNQNNKESLFEVQFIITGDPSWSHSNDSHWNSSFGMPEEITTFGYDFASPLLYSSFESGDTRKLATVLGPGDVHPSPAIQIKNYPKVIAGFAAGDTRYIGTDGKIINTLGTVAKPWRGSDAAQLRSGYYGVKTWRDPNITGNSKSAADKPEYIFSGQNLILMRYAEVLLSKAEAQFKSGDAAGAMATVELVRNRAWGKLANPSVVVPPVVGTDMMKIIINEYRHELAGEFSLWFLLRRSGQHIDYVKQTYGITVPTGHDLMPIPISVIATNPTITQNTGY